MNRWSCLLTTLIHYLSCFYVTFTSAKNQLLTGRFKKTEKAAKCKEPKPHQLILSEELRWNSMWQHSLAKKTLTTSAKSLNLVKQNANWSTCSRDSPNHPGFFLAENRMLAFIYFQNCSKVIPCPFSEEGKGKCVSKIMFSPFLWHLENITENTDFLGKLFTETKRTIPQHESSTFLPLNPRLVQGNQGAAEIHIWKPMTHPFRARLLSQK